MCCAFFDFWVIHFEIGSFYFNFGFSDPKNPLVSILYKKSEYCAFSEFLVSHFKIPNFDQKFGFSDPEKPLREYNIKNSEFCKFFEFGMSRFEFRNKFYTICVQTIYKLYMLIFMFYIVCESAEL